MASVIARPRPAPLPVLAVSAWLNRSKAMREELRIEAWAVVAHFHRSHEGVIVGAHPHRDWRCAVFDRIVNELLTARSIWSLSPYTVRPSGQSSSTVVAG